MTVSPSATVAEASHRLLHEQVRQLLVTEDGKLLGVFGRLNALRVDELQHDRENAQPGWLTRYGPTRRPMASAPTRHRRAKLRRQDAPNRSLTGVLVPQSASADAARHAVAVGPCSPRLSRRSRGLATIWAKVAIRAAGAPIGGR